MNAIERAKQDIEQGDLWLARQRLESYLGSKGYDADVLNLLGRISADMHCRFDAGRFWLMGTEESEEADFAIEEVFNRANRNRAQVVAFLPKAARLKSIEHYPEAVQKRLERLELVDAIVNRARRDASAAARAGDWGWVMPGGCLVVVVLLLILMLIGAVTVVQWIVG